jgi:transcriptional regulator with XRE-family HTH domain
LVLKAKHRIRCGDERHVAADSGVCRAVIRRYREQKGLSEEALAEAAGVHHTYVGLVERGKRKPTLDVAEKLARALGKKLSTLIAEAERTAK